MPLTDRTKIGGQVRIDDMDVLGLRSKTVFSAGIGVRICPASHVGLTLQTDAYVLEEDDDTPDFGATQIGVHYLSCRLRQPGRSTAGRLIGCTTYDQ